MSWLFATVELFRLKPDWQLVIRVHPAEVRLVGSVTQECVPDRLSEQVGSLPHNVRLVPAESPLSSYALMRGADVGIVYSSTTGLEMALLGKPVCCAGKVHYRDKGFTFDVTTKSDFLPQLESALRQHALSADQEALARCYAYAVLFRLPILDSGRLRRATGAILSFPSGRSRMSDGLHRSRL